MREGGREELFIYVCLLFFWFLCGVVVVIVLFGWRMMMVRCFSVWFWILNWSFGVFFCDGVIWCMGVWVCGVGGNCVWEWKCWGVSFMVVGVDVWWLWWNECVYKWVILFFMSFLWSESVLELFGMFGSLGDGGECCCDYLVWGVFVLVRL